jgi:hypothetical protein
MRFQVSAWRTAASMFSFRFKPNKLLHSNSYHLPWNLTPNSEDKTWKLCFTIKSAKFVEICRNYVELTKSVRFPRKICWRSGLGVHCVHPRRPWTSPEIGQLCVGINGCAPPRIGHVVWWKTYCRHSENALALSLWCLHHEAMSDAEQLSSEMVRDWSCKLRRAKV